MEFLGNASLKYLITWVLPVKIKKEREKFYLAFLLLIRNILFGGLK